MADGVSLIGPSGGFHRKRLRKYSRCQLFQANVLSSFVLPLLYLICMDIRCGGDTEVDVNDVGYALEKVIDIRKAEDTWQVDSFGGVAVKSRTPDEVSLSFFSGRHLFNTFYVGRYNVPRP